MSDEDDGHRHPGPGAEFYDVEEPKPTSRDVEQPAARWATLQSALPPDELRRRLLRKLGQAARGQLALTETRSGLLVRWTRGKRVIMAEVALTGWEAGTQIHLTVPKAGGATDKDIEALRRRICSAIE